STATNQSHEFAALVELFDMLAAHRSRASSTDRVEVSAVEDIQSMSIPSDLEPVMRSLASLVDLRQAKETNKGRARRNTVASMLPAEVDSEDDLAQKFPLVDKYPFTFKMMLHKLYELDDWKRKVKDLLESSQSQYRSLDDESNIVKPAKPVELEPSEGRIHFAAGVSGRRRGSVAVRPRSCSVAAPRVSPAKVLQTKPTDEARVIKKRCVGRRKSASGMAPDGPAMNAGWVYESAVSSVE
ncbi:hypothetical protein C8J56DRAFT_749356, partial [Mycena floridula]